MKRSRTMLLILLALPAGLSAQPMTSANYRVSWDVVAGGGGTMSSTNYVVTDTVGQPTPIGQSSSTNYVLEGGFQSPPDFDADLVKDFMDNCILDPNTDQRDTNADGYGNICDPDLDNNGIVNFGDLALLKSVFLILPADPDADLDNDGFVRFGDLALMKFYFLDPPGPSGIAP